MTREGIKYSKNGLIFTSPSPKLYYRGFHEKGTLGYLGSQG